MKRTLALTAPLLAAGFVAAAIPMAATASAAPTGTQNCTFSSEDNSVCQSPGNAQIVATPPPVFYEPFGVYPFGPIITLNGHHRYAADE